MTEKDRQHIEDVRGGARYRIFHLTRTRGRIPADQPQQRHTVEAEIDRINRMVIAEGAEPIDPTHDAPQLLQEAREMNDSGWLKGSGKTPKFEKNP